MRINVKKKGLIFLFISIIACCSCKKDSPKDLSPSSGQIIADHKVVDKYYNIPQYYIDKIKEMWLVYAGESHASGLLHGLNYLETINSIYQVNYVQSGIPEGTTNRYLRANQATWGDLNNDSGWQYSYGEEDWFTSSAAIARTKAGLLYCNSIGLPPSTFGFAWCTDMEYGDIMSSVVDPVYQCHWYGVSENGPQGSRCWGLDGEDNAITGNTINMDTYIKVTQQYIDYCTTNSIRTKVFFTTGPVNPTYNGWNLEKAYQAFLKMEYIRNYVRADSTRILFDYADILCYDDDGSPSTNSWNGHIFPSITPTNLGDGSIGHIGKPGTLRLAKAMWWMLARIAGWDGN